jgi:hypothetical protein
MRCDAMSATQLYRSGDFVSLLGICYLTVRDSKIGHFAFRHELESRTTETRCHPIDGTSRSPKIVGFWLKTGTGCGARMDA